ncbi:DNA integrity scanning protein DisA [Desulfofundulus sp. TPOSR]|jgi:diadenylate cyclase|uniref:DNA integrity scanning protein DisA n=1 Tax=Desulfofundulus kuznetsovii (strain DSM 6115 / VKM B-1805 / 17) TaxID=760568 RepID=A0AAU8Q5Y7_DESK7|nr:DNA integrity scanning diadenylate cyclase DisA [Desulfofundulus sp. TPOSR]AEG16648.1 DNA integrity scanning protein disA [Desulfofundulus kuznetsovii DSM 6115]NHM28675.1 DNA integrity scanning protein DisA [Desulfofundulus sp. TPOSR]
MRGETLKEERVEDRLLQLLRTVAPGTPLREGLENILRAKTGALIVIGDSPEVMEIAEGGFAVNAEFTPANLYELAKMDGAIILSSDLKRILAANTQLIPNLSIPSTETGIRHRTAERVAKQTGALVISISQRRGVITIYKGNLKYVLRDVGVILAKANQAIQTLEKYRSVLDRVVTELSILEFEEAVTLFDVSRAIQRVEMVLRVVKEIEKYISELGVEGRLITMQLEELVTGVEHEGLLIIRDYATATDKPPGTILAMINSWPAEDLLDLSLIARALGYPGSASILDQSVSPRGYRILDKIPRLPLPVIENMVKEFGSLKNILNASIEELDAVEGIGEARARSIKEGLARYREQLQERHN